MPANQSLNGSGYVFLGSTVKLLEKSSAVPTRLCWSAAPLTQFYIAANVIPEINERHLTTRVAS
jgi:hypothetical protein